MRIVVISVPAQRKGIPDYVTALAKGMEAMGHRVDILDAWTGDAYRLPAYEYIAVVAEAVSLFGGKMPEALHRVLASGTLVGKKSAAFLKKTGPFTDKALTNLMRGMEKEGMYINWSDIILSAAHAEELGKRIG
ncbi:hypothetical protein [Treponema primitia]|uniref:hypothetical protein n=1 Tax=Treponema primitia TaxID=88058 RepID=UPI00025557B8|nr:hypothetical protein [Treponema primitia]